MFSLRLLLKSKKIGLLKLYFDPVGKRLFTPLLIGFKKKASQSIILFLAVVPESIN